MTVPGPYIEVQSTNDDKIAVETAKRKATAHMGRIRLPGRQGVARQCDIGL